jgi:DNA adenine methylase
MTAVDFIFLNKTCFNGLYRVNSKGLFNAATGRYKNPSILSDEDNLRKISKALKKVNIVNDSFEKSYDFIDDNTFVYIDPPYRKLNKVSFNRYDNSLFTDDYQVRLKSFVDSIVEKGANVLISNSDTGDNFFDELYENYIIERVLANRRVNSKIDGRGKVSELLIRNKINV